MSILLTLGMKGFSSGLAAARSGLSRFAGGVGKIVSPVTAAIAGIAGALGAGAFVAMLKEQADVIDGQSKLAARLGISTESLAGIMHAADLAGVSQEEMTAGLDRMLRSLGDLQAGSKGAGKDFALLGLTAEDFAGLSVDEAFFRTVDAINSLGTAIDQSYAGMQIFGKSAGKFMPMFASGSAGIREMTEEAKKLGKTFSADQGRQVEAMNDNITRVQGAFKGLATAAVIELAPAIGAVAQGMTEWISSGEGLVFMRDFAAGLINTLIVVLDITHLFQRGLVDLGEKALWLTRLFTIMAAEILRGFKTAANTIVDMFIGIGTTIEDFGKKLGLNIDLTAPLKLAKTKFNELNSGAIKVMEDLEQSQIKAIEGFRASAAAMDNTTSQAQKLRNMMEAIKKAAAQPAKTAEDKSRLKALTAEFERLTKLADEATKKEEEMVSPLMKGHQEALKLNEMLSRGLLSPDAHARGLQKIWMDVEKAYAGPAKGPEALLRGSAQEFSFREQFQRGEAMNPMQRVEAILKAAQEIDKKQLQAAQELVRILGGPAPAEVDF